MTREAKPGGVVTFVWLVVLAGHALFAVVTLSLLPRGFPLLHPRFVVNELVPVLVLVASLANAALLFARPKIAALSLIAYPALWGSTAVALPIVFPLTGPQALWPALTGTLGLSLAYLPLFSHVSAQKVWLGIPFVAGALAGASSVRCLRAPNPTTRPLAQHLPAALPATPGPLPHGVVAGARDVRLELDGRIRVELAPVLEFVSRSPDRFWTIFAPYPYDARPSSPLPVRASGTQSVVVETWSQLRAPVYSHLNSLLELGMTGHERLALRFSPCPEAAIDVLHADYPSGAPARFAYLDERGVFRVVEATDAEKGPYRTLAHGPLARGEPLGIGFFETATGGGRELLRITLHDWSAQLSTALSPTAGYGVAENAIEFRLSAPQRSSSAHLFVTLAGTGVGRGWDSVGHSAGSYRNRVSVAWER